MQHPRRDFLKMSSLATLGWLTNGLPEGFAATNTITMPDATSVIGQYGPWADQLRAKTLPKFSFRNVAFTSVKNWAPQAKQCLADRLAMPDTGPTPTVTIRNQYQYDGLQIEALQWSLPYGPPTEAIVLKPANARGRLPAILAFHDHGGNKYFGTRKITRTGTQHPMMVAHQQEYYEGRAWANEIAKRGYVVLVADAFPFASRRVLLQDVPEYLRPGLTDADPENPEQIKAYNEWAGNHEHIMAKSLFCAGTTWPGVFLAEDKVALDILCAREDVDATRIGCGGLSGGGMRTVFMAGSDARIRCAVCVGFMTTWTDFLLHKSPTHTWMTYVPLLPNELEFPEILGLRAPLPTLVLNDEGDDLYTLPEMRKADAILKEVYTKAKAPDQYRCSYYPGPHKFDQAMQTEAFHWFDQWLQS